MSQSHAFDIDSCVCVSVQHGVTALTFPVALLERETCIQRSAHMASLAGWRPPVDFNDGRAGVAGYPFQYGHKLGKRKVGNLPSPQAFHPIEIEVFDADDGIFAHKLVCQLEKLIAPAIADALICALQIANRPLAVVAAFLTAGYRTMGGSQFVERGFIPLG